MAIKYLNDGSKGTKKSILNMDIYNSYIYDKEVGEKPLDLVPFKLTDPIPLNQYIKENTGIKTFESGPFAIVGIGLVMVLLINIIKR